MLTRLVRMFVTVAGALLLAVMLNLTIARPAATQPLPSLRPELTPTAVPTDWFSATAVLTASAATPVAGDALTVTVQLVTTGTCSFALYDVTLIQSEPLLTHVEPRSNVLGPPGPNPAVWRLAATQSGVTTLSVSFYGETFCNGAWQWTTVHSRPQRLAVNQPPIILPFISHNVPPLPITDLGTLGGEPNLATAINDRGEVVGFSRYAALQTHAFLWRNNVMTDLGTLGGATSVAVAINERGQVAGYSTLGPTPPEHAFLWADGVMEDLHAWGNHASLPVDINLGGEVLVLSLVTGDSPRSFIWANGIITDLNTLGGDSTQAADINDRGQVVGSSKTADGTNHAFLWQHGAIIDIHPAGARSSAAAAINERGQVVGIYYSASNSHGFVWEKGVTTTFEPPGGNIQQIDAFNARGQVAGVYQDGIDMRGFLWSKDTAHALRPSQLASGGAIDLGPIPYFMVSSQCRILLDNEGLVVLNRPSGSILWRSGSITPLGSLSRPTANCPTAMNDRGQIVGSSMDANGEYRAVRWEVTPQD